MNSGNKLFSIIIPHYNSPELLQRLLSTVPDGKDDIEVIVVDDRSDEYLTELCRIKKQYETAGVFFFRNNSGAKGPGTCRNIGIKHATGKWLIFADADDILTADFYDAVSEYKDNEADIVYFKATSRCEDGSIGHRHENVNNTVDNFLKDSSRYNELKLRTDNVGPVAKMTRRSFVMENDIRFGNTMVSEDVVFSVKSGVLAESIAAYDNVIYCICEGRSLTYSSDLAVVRKNFSINNEIFIWMYKYLKANLSCEDWRLLGINGNFRFVEAFQRNYGVLNMIKMFVNFEANGVKAVDFKGMSLSTAPETLKKMIRTRKRLNG